VPGGCSSLPVGVAFDELSSRCMTNGEQQGEEGSVSGRNRYHKSRFERGKWRALVLGQNEGPVTGRVLCSWTNEDKSGDWRLWEVQITALESSST